MNILIKSTYHKQQGAALVTALIILLILTILGVSATSSTSNELKRTNNSQERMRTAFLMQTSANFVLADVMRNVQHPMHDVAMPAIGIPDKINDTTISPIFTLDTSIDQLANITDLATGTFQISYKGEALRGNISSGNDWASGFGEGKTDGEVPIFEAFISVTSISGRSASARLGTSMPRQ